LAARLVVTETPRQGFPGLFLQRRDLDRVDLELARQIGRRLVFPQRGERDAGPEFGAVRVPLGACFLVHFRCPY